MAGGFRYLWAITYSYQQLNQSERSINNRPPASWVLLISRIRYYVDVKTVTGLYYALIYPFWIYSIIAWGNTYSTTLKPLYVLKETKTLRLMTFSKFDEHSSPLFKTLNIIKLHDLVSYQIATFMYRFKNRLPLVFSNFFYRGQRGSSIYYKICCKTVLSPPLSKN